MIFSLSSIVAALLNYSLQIIGRFGPVGVFFLMVLEGLGIPFPSEIIMPLSGILASKSVDLFIEYSLAGSVGGFVGNLILYYISKFGGRPIILAIGKYFGLKETHLQRAELWFNTKGEWTVFVGRFVVGIRSFMSVPAGIVEMNILKFSLFTFTGSLIWSSGLAYVGYIVGYGYVKFLSYVDYLGIIVLLLIIIYVIAIILKRRGKDAGN